MPHSDEPRWLARALAGDREAFADLVGCYWDPIYRWLYALTRRRALTEDLTQEVFLRAWARLPTFRPGTNLRAWLFRIARNCLTDTRRSAAVVRRRPMPVGLLDPAPGPAAVAVGNETALRVQAAVARLPLPYRAAFLLRTQEELPYAEIAAVLGLTEETARWHVCQARRWLLRELGPVLDGELS